MPRNPAVLQAPEPLVQKRNNGRSTKFSSLITPTPAAIMSSSKERARPSGYQKKARTISSTKFLQVTSGGAGAEVVEMGSSSQPEPADNDSNGAAAVRAGVGSSSVVAPSDQDYYFVSMNLFACLCSLVMFIKLLELVPQIDPSVPQPVVQSRRRPLLSPYLCVGVPISCLLTVGNACFA